MPPAILAPLSDSSLKSAINILKNGGLVAFPTETVYGLGGDALNPDAISAIYKVKQRPASHPLIVHISHSTELTLWAKEIPPYAWHLAEAFWPGPMTLVLQRSNRVLDILTGQQNTIAVRIPRHPVAQTLLSCWKSGIVAPSANLFGYISPSTAQHVQQMLGNAIDLIIDGGPCEVGIESSIIDCTGHAPRLLRPGTITIKMIEDALKPYRIEQSISNDSLPLPIVPGSVASHYAPRTPCHIIPGKQIPSKVAEFKNKHVALISTTPPDRSLPALTYQSLKQLSWYPAPDSATQYAHHLYAYLHEVDASGADILLIEDIPMGEAWGGVRDRLQRACHSSSHH